MNYLYYIYNVMIKLMVMRDRMCKRMRSERKKKKNIKSLLVDRGLLS